MQFETDNESHLETPKFNLILKSEFRKVNHHYTPVIMAIRLIKINREENKLLTSISGLSLLVEQAAGAVKAGDDDNDDHCNRHAKYHTEDQRQPAGTMSETRE